MTPTPLTATDSDATSSRRRPLRIAIVTETYPPEVNGVAVTIAQVVAGLRERMHDVQLVRPRQGRHDAVERTDGTRATREMLVRGMPIPRYPHLRLGLPARQALLRQWTQVRPDVVHLATEGPLGWSALQAARQLGLPVTSDFRTNFHAYCAHYGLGWLSRPIAGYLRTFHNRASCTMVPTEALRLELEAQGLRRTLVVGRGVDTQHFDPMRRSEELRRSWKAAASDPVALYVGRLAAEKNLDTLLGASMRCAAPMPR